MAEFLAPRLPTTAASPIPWTTPAAKDIVGIVDPDAAKQLAATAADVLATYNDSCRAATKADLTHAHDSMTANSKSIDALMAGVDAAAARTAARQLCDAKLSVEERLQAFSAAAGIDLAKLQSQLYSSALARAVLPVRVVDWMDQQVEILPTRWDALLYELLTAGLGVQTSVEPIVDADQIMPPWPITAATGDCRANADGSLIINVTTSIAGDAEDSAMVGAQIVVPGACTQVRVDSSVLASWNLGGCAIPGYSSAALHVAIGLWDGTTQLALQEALFGSGYAPALWAFIADGAGTFPMSVELDRAPTAYDVTLTVGVRARGSAGAAGLASAEAQCYVKPAGAQVQLVVL